MGCGGSKDVVVSTNVTEDNNNTETKDVVTSNQRKLAETLNHSDLPGAVTGTDDDIRSDSSNSKTSTTSSSSSSTGKVREKALAFTVPGDEGDPSLIKRHPPLRFRRLEDQQVEISQEMINVKQAEAEKRRTAIIQERAKSARSSSARMKSLPAVKGQYQNRVESAIESHPEMYEEMNVM